MTDVLLILEDARASAMAQVRKLPRSSKVDWDMAHDLIDKIKELDSEIKEIALKYSKVESIAKDITLGVVK